MRPDGYSLSPDDDGYWNFNRQQELGQLRGPSEYSQEYKTADASLLERPEIKIPELEVSAQRELYELGQMIDRNVRESSDIPEFVREDS